MNSFSILAFLLCVALSYSAPADPKDHYTTKYDNFDLAPVLKSKRLVQQYVKCVLEGVGCTAEGKTLREYLPDALKTNCAKCTDRQRLGASTVMSTLEKEYPEELKKVLDRFDKDRKLFEAFKKSHFNAQQLHA